MIASGNHILTQVKDNQPNLRRRLELGTAGRKPSGSAVSRAKGRNRWETRELKAFPAKAWFRKTPWENLIQTVLRLERTIWKRDPKTGVAIRITRTWDAILSRFINRMDTLYGFGLLYPDNCSVRIASN